MAHDLTQRLIQWHSIGHSSADDARRRIHPAKLPNAPDAWQQFIEQTVDPRGPRVLLHNPFGIEPAEPDPTDQYERRGSMAYDQYVEAQATGDQRYAWLTDGFVEAWRQWLAAAPGREVIGYLGTLHDHRDNPRPWRRLSQLTPAQLSWRLWLSTRPLLDAGCSVAIDSTGYLDPDDPDRPDRRLTASEARRLQAMGVTVYVEPNPSHEAWLDCPCMVYESVWRGRRKIDPDGQRWPWSRYRGEVVRLLNSPQTIGGIDAVLEDGHTCAAPAWLIRKYLEGES